MGSRWRSQLTGLPAGVVIGGLVIFVGDARSSPPMHEPPAALAEQSATAPADFELEPEQPEPVLNFKALLQAWLFYASDARNPYVALQKSKWTSLLRRAEAGVSVELPSKVRFWLMMDAAKVMEPNGLALSTPTAPREAVVIEQGGPISMLQDAVLSFDVVEGLSLSVGQGLLPLTSEAGTAPGEILLATRSQLARRFGDRRDIGCWTNAALGAIELQVGIYNGSGPAKINRDKNAEAVGRLIWSLQTIGLRAGLSGQRTIGPKRKELTTIAGADILYEHRGWTVLTEVYWRRYKGSLSTDTTSELGATLSAGKSMQGLGMTWRPALRVDFFDEDASSDSGGTVRVAGGLSLRPKPGLRLQLDYERAEPIGDTSALWGSEDVLIMNFQFSL